MAGIGKEYQVILEGLKEKIRQARQKAAIVVNTELLGIYWEIGNTIMQQENNEGWGAKTIEKLSKDLKSEFPDMKGLSLRNLRYMRDFSLAWPHFPFLQAPLAKLQPIENQRNTFLQAPLAKLPWYHHITLLDKVKDQNLRLFYLHKAIENGWSRNIMLHQIETQLHLRQGNAITNFEVTLPKPQSDLAGETLKNPYIFDFLGIGDEMHERDLEKALIQHIKKFMLELGRGFAYVGNQYNIKVENDDYFLDLLFYNYHLHCFVVFELKVGAFKAEYTGKLNMYINTINNQIKGADDKPTVGVLLCKTPNETLVKYSLQGVTTPMGIAEYEFTKALPKQLKGEIPTIEELEKELDKEVEMLRKPIDEKRDKLKEILRKIKGEEIKKGKENGDVVYLFEEVLNPIRNKIKDLLKEEISLFTKARFEVLINDMSGNFMMPDLEIRFIKNESVHKLGLFISLEGFKKGGVRAFSVWLELVFGLEEFKYKVQLNKTTMWKEYLYHYKWNEDELKDVAEKWSEVIIDEINRKLMEIV